MVQNEIKETVLRESFAGWGRVPKHLAIERYILNALQDGRYPLGSRLPGDRELAKSLNVNALTLQHAMRRLCQQGVLERRPRVGTFVRIAGCEPNVAILVFNDGRKDSGVSHQLLQEMQDEGQTRGHQVRPFT